MSKKYLTDKELEEILARSDSEHDEPMEQDVSTEKKLYYQVIICNYELHVLVVFT